MADGKPVDLVLEGGGVKGIGLLGAVLVLHDQGYRFQRIAGTSAGAIVAALVAAYQKAGRDLHELEDVMHGCEYRKFQEDSLLHRVLGKAGDGIEFLLHRGAHTGDYLYEWLGPLFEAVGVTKFGDLRLDDPNTSLQDYQRYSLVVHTSDLSRRALVRLPWDYAEYGRKADDELLVDAVRASMSIPFFFRPVEFETGERKKVTWVDGGLLSNFPITVFDRTDGVRSRWPTWGVKLSGRPRGNHDSPIRSPLGIATGSLQTLMADWNRYRLDDEGVNQRTIFVDTGGISATDFGLSPETQATLYSSGQEAARRFLAQLPSAVVE
ncbi:patatin-like phospholipase family protein [Amycolatopsis acidicola]|uniref:Patatin-like phospholipase family protein n=1 Tax=Amycolatopsis acidicola TaxID=2596893 RepID=A0A5N0V826_9PSEU|nr:patatin-like phospholipase family protein [Amycolatopsis acidicola]KAA9161383.1 patatin-like phospholipase family protein [Amycolatopsis acidicola]